MSKSALEQFDEDNGESDASANESARNRLRSLIERVERVEDEIKALQEDRKDIFAEAKSAGFDTAVMRLIIKRRRLEPADREEIDSMLDLYERELGM